MSQNGSPWFEAWTSEVIKLLSKNLVLVLTWKIVKVHNLAQKASTSVY